MDSVANWFAVSKIPFGYTVEPYAEGPSCRSITHTPDPVVEAVAVLWRNVVLEYPLPRFDVELAFISYRHLSPLCDI